MRVTSVPIYISQRYPLRSSITRKIRVSICLLCFWVTTALFTTFAYSAPFIGENDLKAAYLYKITKFIEWPESAFDTPNSGINLCVVGNNPFSKPFYELSGKFVGKRPLNIVHHKESLRLSHCHILYIAMSDRFSALEVAERLKQSPVLTVSDVPNFVQSQGMVGFVTRSQRILIEINLVSALSVNIGIRAQLLEVAHRVVRSDGGDW